MAEIVLKPGSPSGSYFNNNSPVYGSPDGIYGGGIAWQVVNSASIGGASVGVYLAAGGSLTQTNTGYITGRNIGVEISGGRGTVSNAGTIAGGQAVELTAGGAVANNVGGVIEGTYGVRIDGAGTVSNAGVISTSGNGPDYSVYGHPFYGGGFGIAIIGNAAAVVGNTGTIVTTGVFGDGVFIAGAAGTVDNSGTIAATGHYGLGIYLHTGGSVSNSAGLIEGYSGIRSDNAAAAVMNDGTIEGVGPNGGIAVELFDGGSVANKAEGLIEGHAGGVSIAGGAGTIANYGTIAGGAGGAGGYGGNGAAGGTGIVLAGGGNIGNTGGTIAGGAGGAGGDTRYNQYGANGGAGGAGIVLSQIGSIANSGGMITGGQGGAGGNIIGQSSNTFRGGYGGAGGIGIVLSQSGSIANTGGLIAGGQGGAGGNSVGSYSFTFYDGHGGAGGIGIALSQGGSIVNSGTIAGGQGGTGGGGGQPNSYTDYGGNGGAGGIGITLSQNGSIGNSGLIVGGEGGAGGNTGNYGYRGGGGGGGDGIVLSQGGSIGNTGTIAGGAGGAGGTGRGRTGAPGGAGYGIVLADGGIVSNGDASHTGALIEGGIGIQAFGATATVSNYGTVIGSTQNYGVGVQLGDGGTVANSGLIAGDFAGVYTTGAAATVSNYGTVTGYRGIQLWGGGTVVNRGLFAGSASGIYTNGAAGAAVTVSNYGTVTGSYKALRMWGGGAVTNRGLIEGLGDGVGIEGRAGAVLVNNYGTVTGNTGILLQDGGTVLNAGTIATTNGPGGEALSFGNGVTRLIVDPGAAFYGLVRAGGGGTDNTLELAAGSGTGTLGGLGSSFVNFTKVTVDAGASWMLTGTNAVPSLTDSGSLVNSGSIAADVTLTAGAYLDNTAMGTITAGPGPNLVVNGSFEDPNVGTYYGIFGNGSVPGWTSNNNEIEVDYTNILGGNVNAYAGTQSVELNGNTFDTISQTINGLTPGLSYTLSWAYGTRPGSGPEQTKIYFGGALVATDSVSAPNPNAVIWTPNSITVIATSASETLSFAAINVGNGSVGNEIDAVSLIAQDQPAVAGSGGPSTVANVGTIAGGVDGGDGIALASGGTVTNGDASHPGALIQGGIGIDASGAAATTVTNFGTVAGTGGTALRFGAASDTLVVEAGSKLVGSAQGGGGTLDLAGDAGAGTLTGLGTQYTGFAQVAVLAGAAWTLTSSGDVSSFSLGDGSSLEFQGGAASGQSLDFTGNSGLARLDAPAQFAATIADFRVGDTLDLASTATTGLSYAGTASGGTLTVLNGAATVAALALSGPYVTGQFALTSDDNGGSDIVLKPPAVAAQNYAISENTVLNETAAQGVLAGASAGTVFAVAITDPQHGSLALNQDGSFTYTPSANFYGVDSFTFTGSYPAGEGTSAAATATIAVADTTVPGETVGGPYTGDENSVIALPGLSVTASPNSDDPLSTVLSVAHGTLTVGQQTGATITLAGTSATINSSLAGLSYTGALNYVGADTLTMTTTDTVDNNQAMAKAGIDINPQNVTVGNGNGTVALGSGNDTVSLGTGSDTVTGGDGSDTISVSGGAGNDSVTLGNGNDSVTLANGSNTVTLGNGNDTVMLGQGANTVSLGTGSDTVIVGNNNNAITAVGSATSTDSISAGNGNNTLNLGSGTYDIVLGNGNNTVNMAGGTYDVTAGHGTDLFVFDTPQAVLDMKFASNDELVFRNSGFDFGSFDGSGTATPQPLPGTLFSPNTDGTFATAANRFAYNASSGDLYYDAKGGTPGSTATLVADLINKPHLTGAGLFFTS